MTTIATRRDHEVLTPTAELAAAVERMELTEKGWVEKVTYPAHGRMQTRLTMRLLALGIDPDTLLWGIRLTREPLGRWYVPDGVVVLPTNSVPVVEGRLYAGAPDLVIEILSPGPEDRERDVCFEETLTRIAALKVAYDIGGLKVAYDIGGPNSNTVVRTLLDECDLPVVQPASVAPGFGHPNLLRGK